MVCDILVTTEIVAEAALFSFDLKRGGEEIRSLHSTHCSQGYGTVGSE